MNTFFKISPLEVVNDNIRQGKLNLENYLNGECTEEDFRNEIKERWKVFTTGGGLPHCDFVEILTFYRCIC